MLRQADGNTDNGGCCQCVEHARNAFFLLFACHQETSSFAVDHNGVFLTMQTTIAPTGPAVAALLVAGAALTLQLPVLPPSWLLWTVLAAAVLTWWRCSGWLRLPAALVIGLALCGLHAASSLALRWLVAESRADVVVEGEVIGLPVQEAGRTRFVLRVDADDAMPEGLRGKNVRLAWYDARDGVVDARRLDVDAGSRWRFSARLRPPRGLRNPGSADAERQAMARRLAASGHVRSNEPVERLSVGRGIDHWRDGMAGRIDAAVEGNAARFIRALSIGDTRALDDADWEALRATGLTHLVAISGFHVGMVGAFFALVASALWRWRGAGRVRRRRR